MMVPSSASCHSLNTRKQISWPYDERYEGHKDKQNRRNGDGVNHWTGAESMEWYTGRFLRDTMHGPGDYRWRYRGSKSLFVTYEGNFYGNRIHGYGAMSYPDGRVFTGLFNNNIRYGPGIESFACRRENVGLWRGTKLVRLAWRPPAPSVVPELHAGPIGRAFVEPHRVVLRTSFRTIGKTNSAVELLKNCGSEPLAAAENWTKLYPKNCTDTASQLCDVEMFDNDFYKGKIYALNELESHIENNEEFGPESQESFEETGPYFAWNNDKMAIDIMKHCFKHERQRSIGLLSVLSGPRRQFQRAAIHELDSRTLLMASYLGHVASTTFLVNERGVDPNITDMQGNSAVMYAACGSQVDIIDFLVEAGANVDSYNDACCTALGMGLMRFACLQADISVSGIVQAMLPPPMPPNTSSITQEHQIVASEWNINRELPPPPNTLQKTPSKLGKITTEKSTTKREKSLMSVKESASNKKKTEITKLEDETGYESDESLNEENKLYKDINSEYVIKVHDLFSLPSGPSSYLFQEHDMVRDVLEDELLQKESKAERNTKKLVSKVFKEVSKASKEAMWQNTEKADSITSTDKSKTEMLEKIKSTILHLLDKGAHPKLVRCPHPALTMAIVSGCPDVVRHLIHYGADVNEVSPNNLNDYSMLAIAISQQMSDNNLEIIRELLQGGAQADHRLSVTQNPPNPTDPVQKAPGPTLLHAILARKLENEYEEDIRKQIVELLLEYNCDPLAQFNGRSAFDVASKSMELLDIIITSPKTNLNAIINNQNQTILVKMFSMPYFKTIDNNERLQTLTNLLLFGADPLMECQNGAEQYANLFVFTKKALMDLEKDGGTDAKGKKEPKKEDKVKPSKSVAASKSVGKVVVDDLGNFKQSIDLITECARILHIRWLQAKLTKEIIEVIDKYKHRNWNVILRDHKNKKAAGLWLMPQRCLEIWDILKTTKKKIYKNKRTLKHLLCIVHFYFLRSRTAYRLDPVTAAEKDLIENNINCMLYEHKKATNFGTEMFPLQRLYVQPELFVYADSEFEVCFECSLPLQEERIKCQSCKLVSFCNVDCIKENIDRTGCHPCSDYLKDKYCPSPPSSKCSVVRPAVDKSGLENLNESDPQAVPNPFSAPAKSYRIRELEAPTEIATASESELYKVY